MVRMREIQKGHCQKENRKVCPFLSQAQEVVVTCMPCPNHAKQKHAAKT